MIVDDYFLPACAKAVNDFRERYGITSPILPIDGWDVLACRPRADTIILLADRPLRRR